MKLIIQIPCFNEAEQLPKTLADLPKHLPGVDTIEWLVVDDGSTDNTAVVAAKLGVHHVVRFPRNHGLAQSFSVGIDAALRNGADLIVNTDADNQYCAADIERLIQPLLEGCADIVIGARPIEQIEQFSRGKKILQRLGTWLVRLLSNTTVVDATSGFRAYTRKAAMALNVFSKYTYTLETIIQAGQKGMAVMSVPVRVNPPTRPSRLIRSTAQYIWRSGITMVRIFIIYRPFRFFMLPAVLSGAVGVLIGLRFLGYYLTEGGAGHVQSLILSAILIIVASLLASLAILADLQSVNRHLLEDIQSRLRWQEIAVQSDAVGFETPPVRRLGGRRPSPLPRNM